MSEINQLKKLMEAVDEAYAKPGTPYQNYKPEEGNDTYDKKTGERSRNGQYDEKPFIQSQNLSGDDIIDRYEAGNISYEEAEVEIRQLHPDPDEATILIAALNNAYGDTEVDWDEESGGGVVREAHKPFGDNRLPYDFEFDNEDITIFTLGGKPVLEMSLDDWTGLISKFNRAYRGK